MESASVLIHSIIEITFQQNYCYTNFVQFDDHYTQNCKIVQKVDRLWSSAIKCVLQKHSNVFIDPN